MRSFKPPVVVRPDPVRLTYAPDPKKVRVPRRPPPDPVALSAFLFATLVFPTAGVGLWKWLASDTVSWPLMLLVPGSAAASVVLASWARWRPIPMFRPCPGAVRGAFGLVLLQLLIAGAATTLALLQRQFTAADPCIRCQANLQTLGKAVTQYASQNNQQLPPDLPTAVFAAGFGEDQLVCPAAADALKLAPAAPTRLALLEAMRAHCSYTLAPLPSDATLLTRSQIIAFESKPRHDDRINVLYGDGRVETMSKTQAEEMLAAFRLGHNPPW